MAAGRRRWVAYGDRTLVSACMECMLSALVRAYPNAKPWHFFPQFGEEIEVELTGRRVSCCCKRALQSQPQPQHCCRASNVAGMHCMRLPCGGKLHAVIVLSCVKFSSSGSRHQLVGSIQTPCTSHPAPAGWHGRCARVGAQHDHPRQPLHRPADCLHRHGAGEWPGAGGWVESQGVGAWVWFGRGNPRCGQIAPGVHMHMHCLGPPTLWEQKGTLHFC